MAFLLRLLYLTCFYCSSMNLFLLRVLVTDVLLDDMDKTCLTLLQVGKDDRIWCPICKRGELRENVYLIYCTCCGLQLDIQSDKVLSKITVCISFCMWWICLIFNFIIMLRQCQHKRGWRLKHLYPINLIMSSII